MAAKVAAAHAGAVLEKAMYHLAAKPPVALRLAAGYMKEEEVGAPGATLHLRGLLRASLISEIGGMRI